MTTEQTPRPRLGTLTLYPVDGHRFDAAEVDLTRRIAATVDPRLMVSVPDDGSRITIHGPEDLLTTIADWLANRRWEVTP